MVHVEFADSLLRIRAHYDDRHACAAIPGAKWVPSIKRWEYLLTPATASCAAQTFGQKLSTEDQAKLRDLWARLLNIPTIKQNPAGLEQPQTQFPCWEHQVVCYNIARELFGFVSGSEAGGGVMFALDMGLGKTKCAVDVIVNHPDQIRSVLVTCPSSVIDVWTGNQDRIGQFEIHALPEQYAKLHVFPVKGKNMDTYKKTKLAENARRIAEMHNKTFIAVVNYETAWREPFASWAKDAKFDMIVADECVPSGTMIATPHGNRYIEDLKPGDIVLGEKDGQIISSTVLNTFLKISNESLHQINKTPLTGNHPVWTQRGYIRADGVSPVDIVLLLNDFKTYQQAGQIKTVKCKTNGQRLYNIETTTGNYFANGLLVHNCHRLKSPGGKASKFFALLGRSVKYRLGLSGTPMSHTPLDIYGQYRFLDPGIFGTSYSKFRAEFAVMGGFQGHQVLNFKNLDTLNQKFYMIAHRVMSKDVMDLPEFQVVERTCELEGQELKVYQQMNEEFCAEVEGNLVTAANALVKLLRLQEITSGFLDGQQVGSSKAKLLADVLEDFDLHEPVVIMAHFTNDLKMIKKVCEAQGRTYAELSGHANQLSQWQIGKFDVLGVQIKSGREGVDLTRARYTIYYSMGFSLGDYEQSMKRTDRPGQTREGLFIHLLAENSVDLKVMKSLQHHKEVITAVLDMYKEEIDK